MTVRLLVCGGRDYRNRRVVFTTLNDIHRKAPISALIHGGATGADTLAGEWASENEIEVKVYLADWNLGPAAGPIRNQAMLDHGKPNLVVAFPGGRGTADMVRRARAAGIEVMDAKEKVHPPS